MAKRPLALMLNPRKWRTGKLAVALEHWDREHYLPFTPNELIDSLLSLEEASSLGQESFLRVATHLKQLVRLKYREHHEDLMDLYAKYDPDRDFIERSTSGPKTRIKERPPSEPRKDETSLPLKSEEPAGEEQLAATLEGRRKVDFRRMFSEIGDSLHHANYRRLSPREIQNAIGLASHWGVRLKIRFSSFRRLEVYGRGDIITRRTVRLLKNFYKAKEIEVPIYQRLVVVFWPREKQAFSQMLHPNRLHIRMFKNVPRSDIDMMLPGSQVRLTWIDRGKIGIPTLWGIVMMSSRLARGLWVIALFGTLKMLSSFFLVIAIVIATIFYGIKSIFSYSTAKRRYQLHVAQNLYYQTLDNNLGALLRIEEEAEQQEICEAVMTYFVLACANKPLSSEEIDEIAERHLNHLTKTAIDFDVDDGIRDLSKLQCIQYKESGWVAVSPF